MSGNRILAFEADPLYANMLTEELGSHGFQVEVVSDGVEGLEKATSTHPDLIYLSIELPRISGFSICNKLRKNVEAKDIPLIITSSEATVETFDKHKKLKFRADEYIHKPFDGAQILAIVTKLIDVPEGGTADVTAGGPSGSDDIDDLGELEELSDVDDIDDFDMDEVGSANTADSDIAALAERAFDAIEISSRSSAPDISQVDDNGGASERNAKGDNESEGGAGEQLPRRDSFLEFKTANLSTKIEKLEKENAELRKKNEAVEKEVITLKATKRGGVSSSEFLELRETLNKKDRELLNLKDSLNSKEKELLDSRERITALERQQADLEDRNLDVAKQLNETEEHLDQMTADKEVLAQKARNQDERLSQLQEQVATLENDLDEEKQGRESDNEHAEQEMVAAVAAHKADKAQTVDDLNGKYTREIEELTKAHTARETDLADNIVRLEKEKSELEEKLEEKLATAERRLTDTEHRLDETTKSLDDTRNKLTATQKNLEETAGTLKNTEEKLEAQIEKTKDLEGIIADRDSQISDLEKDLDDLNSTIANNDDLIDKTRKALAIAMQLLDSTVAAEVRNDENQEDTDQEEEAGDDHDSLS